MRLSDLKKFDLVYVGTPYSRYAAGLDAAYVDACKLTAELLKAGVNAYSPIVHCHGIAVHGGIDALDHEFWLKLDASMMKKSGALVVAMLDGWEHSSGLQEEMQTFVEASKPVAFLDPADLSVELATAEERAQMRPRAVAA